MWFIEDEGNYSRNTKNANLQYMTIIYPPAGKLKLKIIKECRYGRKEDKSCSA